MISSDAPSPQPSPTFGERGSARVAAVLLAAIGSSLIFVSVSPYWLRAVQGSLILLTVLADLARRRRQARDA